MATLTAESILGSSVELTKVDIWGGEVYLRPMAGKYLRAVDEANERHTKGELSTIEVAAIMLGYTMCGEDGKLIFDEGQSVTVLCEKPLAEVMGLLETSNELCGFVSTEELEKN